MTTEEIIKGLESVKTECGKHLNEGFAWICKPIDEAIEVLKRKPCEDCVSRDAVHDMLENLPIGINDKWFNWLQKACLRLADLPPVTPERPKGKWLTPYGSYSYRLTTYKCSLCGCETDNRSNYCPSCGAYMREVSE